MWFSWGETPFSFTTFLIANLYIYIYSHAVHDISCSYNAALLFLLNPSEAAAAVTSGPSNHNYFCVPHNLSIQNLKSEKNNEYENFSFTILSSHDHRSLSSNYSHIAINMLNFFHVPARLAYTILHCSSEHTFRSWRWLELLNTGKKIERKSLYE